ncbi:hypothetical protein ACFX2I_013504 [Malus domestica]
MYNPYSSSCHQLGDEMYNPYSNIIRQLAIHATNQVKNGGQPQFSKASHTLDQYSVKQNQFMVPTGASSIDGNHNSQKLHTLLIKTV